MARSKKEQYTPYQSLKQSDYVINREQEGNPNYVPIVDHLAMVHKLDQLAATCAEVDEDRIAADRNAAYTRFMAAWAIPKEFEQSVDKTNEKFQKKFDSVYNAEFIQYEMNPADHTLKRCLCRNEFDDPTRYDAMIRNWEDEWRDSLNKDLGDYWLYGDNSTADKFVEGTYIAGKLGHAANIPTWLFAADTFQEPEFHMNTVQKIALAHAIHHTLGKQPYGYIEAAGEVERMCRVGVREVHEAFIWLQGADLVDVVYVPANRRWSRTRSCGWFANIPKIITVLENYGRVITV